MNINRMENIVKRLAEIDTRLNRLNDVVYGMSPKPKSDDCLRQQSDSMLTLFNDIDNSLQDIYAQIDRLEEAMISQPPSSITSLKEPELSDRSNYPHSY